MYVSWWLLMEYGIGYCGKLWHHPQILCCGIGCRLVNDIRGVWTSNRHMDVINSSTSSQKELTSWQTVLHIIIQCYDDCVDLVVGLIEERKKRVKNGYCWTLYWARWFSNMFCVNTDPQDLSLKSLPEDDYDGCIKQEGYISLLVFMFVLLNLVFYNIIPQPDNNQ